MKTTVQYAFKGVHSGEYKTNVARGIPHIGTTPRVEDADLFPSVRAALTALSLCGSPAGVSYELVRVTTTVSGASPERTVYRVNDGTGLNFYLSSTEKNMAGARWQGEPLTFDTESAAIDAIIRTTQNNPELHNVGMRVERVVLPAVPGESTITTEVVS